jgi:hypothetical protein
VKGIAAALAFRLTVTGYPWIQCNVRGAAARHRTGWAGTPVHR